jgi:hypothetical protein
MVYHRLCPNYHGFSDDFGAEIKKNNQPNFLDLLCLICIWKKLIHQNLQLTSQGFYMKKSKQLKKEVIYNDLQEVLLKLSSEAIGTHIIVMLRWKTIVTTSSLENSEVRKSNAASKMEEYLPFKTCL